VSEGLESREGGLSTSWRVGAGNEENGAESAVGGIDFEVGVGGGCTTTLSDGDDAEGGTDGVGADDRDEGAADVESWPGGTIGIGGRNDSLSFAQSSHIWLTLLVQRPKVLFRIYQSNGRL